MSNYKNPTFYRRLILWISCAFGHLLMDLELFFILFPSIYFLHSSCNRTEDDSTIYTSWSLSSPHGKLYTLYAVFFRKIAWIFVLFKWHNQSRLLVNIACIDVISSWTRTIYRRVYIFFMFLVECLYRTSRSTCYINISAIIMILTLIGIVFDNHQIINIKLSKSHQKDNKRG